ncbi:HNH endonuclease, partial [Pseudomonas aeruginosa]
MHAFIDFIFHEVWCKAPAGGDYSLDLFVANPELHEVMTAFHYDDSNGAEFFSGHVERIYGFFSVLSDAQISQFQQWYQGNNDLEKVCANDPATQLTRYSDIAANHKDLATQLGTFFKGLYSQSLLNLVALRGKIGDIDDHYQTFVQANKAGKCPFCGINDLLGEYHNKREAYDHYLPKALYPFNSINFRNLVPACHHCNSSYKTSKDPAYTPKDPARA